MFAYSSCLQAVLPLIAQFQGSIGEQSCRDASAGTDGAAVAVECGCDMPMWVNQRSRAPAMSLLESLGCTAQQADGILWIMVEPADDNCFVSRS